ncbi:Shedu anti-phage system protein SduA domain-containing protein [Streptomyces sp. NPDC001930]|uniref:Shedu anti-phage system protein SduA domain-containing protein n=1 Tax=Streptomyces sp. NPDC001930 TaxID=3364625 RepID=UPI003674F763
MDAHETLIRATHQQLTAVGFVRICSDDHDATPHLLPQYEACLAAAEDEKPLQEFLAKNPSMLTQQLGGSCRWVRPQVPLGDAYVPDFLVARTNSVALHWTLVELESPTAPLFLKSKGKQNRPAEKLREGLDQVTEWRRWLAANTDYAQRPRRGNKEGLGLVEINQHARGLVLIGRRADMSNDDRVNRQHLSLERQTEVQTYDWLADEARRAHRNSLSFDEPCYECALLG